VLEAGIAALAKSEPTDDGYATGTANEVNRAGHAMAGEDRVRHDRVRVLVPRLVGLELAPAYRIALLSGIALCGPDPEQVLPLRGVISNQQPTAGTTVWSGDPVTVSLTPSR